MPSSDSSLKVAARASPLSRAQVQEVSSLLREYEPSLVLEPYFVQTSGDLDLSTSLLYLEKSDFFTKEVDDRVLSGQCRIAVHSAKDLPDPLPEGLVVVAYTKGVDPSDVLVFQPEQMLSSLPPCPRVGVSSLRRIHNLQMLFPSVQPVDIRGTIERRLALLDAKEVDALVMAKAALIRLGIQRQTWTLPGVSAPLQGRLAIVARQDDVAMQALFAPLHEPLLP